MTKPLTYVETMSPFGQCQQIWPYQTRKARCSVCGFLHSSRHWNYLEKPMNLTPTDAVIDEVRAVRRKISARFNHDPARLVAYYEKLQEQFQSRLLTAEQRAAPSG